METVITLSNSIQVETMYTNHVKRFPIGDKYFGNCQQIKTVYIAHLLQCLIFCPLLVMLLFLRDINE